MFFLNQVAVRMNQILEDKPIRQSNTASSDGGWENITGTDYTAKIYPFSVPNNGPLTAESTPLEFFQLFYTDNLLTTLVTNTMTMQG